MSHNFQDIPYPHVVVGIRPMSDDTIQKAFSGELFAKKRKATTVTIGIKKKKKKKKVSNDPLRANREAQRAYRERHYVSTCDN